ncbi:hypothetical protein [Malikia spinosa]|uniref:Uncharacterized protein n=1 Tax=Malikia spinosa TaxID=86180 RepID=A0A7C9IWE3_9BURK|nr:hypothetical protein [Malikia spinosa]MYZ50874.1 hypothetical protein [Malikia spinosa]
MPHALIAGVPMGWSRQVRGALDKVKVPDWTFSVFPGSDPKIAGISDKQLPDLLADAAKRGGAHVFCVSDGRDRQRIATAIREHFRFRWLASDVVRTATTQSEPLVKDIERAIKEEIEWRNALHPIVKSSPLALPQRGFSAERSVEAIWSMSESFNKEDGFFAKVGEALEQFRMQHLKKWDKHRERFFIDLSNRVWKDDGPYHGDAPFPRDWKYSSALPERFHFDVQHAQRKAFNFNDRAGRGKSVATSKHCNVDAHGYLR